MGGPAIPEKASAAMTGFSGTIKAKPRKRSGAVYAACCAAASGTRPCLHGMTTCDALASLPFRQGAEMGELVLKALRAGLWGLLIGPLLAVIIVFGAMIFDPKCGVGDSGGCAMGVITAPVAIALPSFGLFFAISLLRGLWQRRPSDPVAAIRRLRNWGRED